MSTSNTAAYYEFKPYNVGRWIVWGLFALRRADVVICAGETLALA